MRGTCRYRQATPAERGTRRQNFPPEAEVFRKRLQDNTSAEAANSSGRWSTMNLLSVVKDHIMLELRINHLLEVGTVLQANTREYNGCLPRQRPFGCFYCEKPGHPPKNCKEVPTGEKRLIATKNNLCWNCRDNEHVASQCKRGSCRMCKEFGHHTSICHKLEPKSPPSSSAGTTLLTKKGDISEHARDILELQS